MIFEDLIEIETFSGSKVYTINFGDGFNEFELIENVYLPIKVQYAKPGPIIIKLKIKLIQNVNNFQLMCIYELINW